MSTTHTAWSSLVRSALLGTERQSGVELPVEGALGTLLRQLNAADTEAALLGATGIVSLYQRAGRVPPSEEQPLPSPCDIDDLPECGAASRQHLQTMLERQFAGALPEWLGALATAKRRVPSDCLPALLDLGKQQEALQPRLLPALGKRGHWLAGQNAQWDYAVAGDDEVLWQTGTSAMRRALLRRTRANTPARAREWLSTTWSADAPADRAAFLAEFAVGLSDEDEIFLEQALSDSRKEVRKVAADLLARLTGSAYCKRMAARVNALVHFKGGLLRKTTIEVNLSDQCDAAMQRDGIDPKPRAGTGEKAWWLLQMIGAAPLRLWREAGDKNPAQIVEAASSSDWQLTLLEGWALAAARQRDAEWAEALLTIAPQLATPDKKDDTLTTWRLALLSTFIESLPSILPDKRRDAWMLELLRARRDVSEDQLLVIPLLRQAKYAWGITLSRGVLDRLRMHAKRANPTLDAMITYMLEDLAYCMSPAVVGEASRDWPNGDEASALRWRERMDAFTTLLHFRAEMLEALRDGGREKFSQENSR